jgi:hypothetical protein
LNQSVGAGSVTGFIETNGAIGPITPVILDWNLTLFDGSNTADLQGPQQNNPNSSVTLRGSALSATATTLSFDFGATNGELSFLFTGSDPIYLSYASLGGCVSLGCGSSGTTIEVLSFQFGARSGIGTIGTATPLPAALPLFATGLAGLGLLGWRRKRKAQAVA